MTSERETNVGVLDKIMAILHAFTHGDTTLSLQEIASRTDLPLPTVYRLAQALSEHGMLEKESRSFRLGITLMHLGALVTEGIDLRRQLLPLLKWLNAHTEENAELHIRRGEMRVAIEVVSSSKLLRPIVDIGAPMPLHLGAGGKILLAWLPAAEQEALVRASSAYFSPGQPFDFQTLRAQLEQVRATGWVASESERTLGAASIAAPIFDAASAVRGAICLVAPAVRLPEEQRQKFTPLVREAAARASRILGYKEMDYKGTHPSPDEMFSE